MLEDEACVAAVAVNEDVLRALLHNARRREGVAARELREMGFFEGAVPFEYARLHFVRPCRAVCKGEIRCAFESYG